MRSFKKQKKKLTKIVCNSFRNDASNDVNDFNSSLRVSWSTVSDMRIPIKVLLSGTSFNATCRQYQGANVTNKTREIK